MRLVRAVAAGALRSKRAGPSAARNVAADMIGGLWSVVILIAAARLVAPFTPGLPEAAIGGIDWALRLALILQAASWARRLVAAFTEGVMSRKDLSGGAATAASLITTLTGAVIWALAAMMVLTSFGIEIGPLIAGLGVGGLAVGLAAQSVFRDLFSSIAIVFDQPFARGDFISFSNGAVAGTVEKIGVKTTRLRSLSGEQVIVGNAMILDQEIRNFQRLSARRAVHELAVVYQTPHETLKRIPDWLREAVEAAPNARFDRCHLKAYGDSGVVFELVFWADVTAYTAFMDVQQAVLLGVNERFERAGVDFAYPTRTVYVAN